MIIVISLLLLFFLCVCSTKLPLTSGLEFSLTDVHRELLIVLLINTKICFRVFVANWGNIEIERLIPEISDHFDLQACDAKTIDLEMVSQRHGYCANKRPLLVSFSRRIHLESASRTSNSECVGAR